MGYYKNQAVKRQGSRHSSVTQEYAREWFQKMVEIWGDKIRLLQVYDTGNLSQSVRTDNLALNEDTIRMSFEFLHYGVYVDAGVGNGYTHDNGGDLEILNKLYREEHGLDKPRRRGRKADGKMTSGKPRDRKRWFSPSWFISVEVFKEKLAEIYGEEYVGLFGDL